MASVTQQTKRKRKASTHTTVPSGSHRYTLPHSVSGILSIFRQLTHWAASRTDINYRVYFTVVQRCKLAPWGDLFLTYYYFISLSLSLSLTFLGIRCQSLFLYCQGILLPLLGTELPFKDTCCWSNKHFCWSNKHFCSPYPFKRDFCSNST